MSNDIKSKAGVRELLLCLQRERTYLQIPLRASTPRQELSSLMRETFFPLAFTTLSLRSPREAIGCLPGLLGNRLSKFDAHVGG